MSVLTQPADLHAIEKLREQELEEARAIQGVMLPGQPLRTDCATISHEFQPAAEVGGDFLDYFLLPDGMIGLYLGDVSGKGLPAALLPLWRLGRCEAFIKPASLLPECSPSLNRGCPPGHPGTPLRDSVRHI